MEVNFEGAECPYCQHVHTNKDWVVNDNEALDAAHVPSVRGVSSTR